MSQERKPASSKGSKPQSRTGKREPREGGSKRREGTEGNNAIQSQPDDSRQTSMLDSGKHSEKSPYTAGAQ
ncbi:MAG: hypothetical protein V4757_17635 [Pseudomonadota bacterium]